MVLAPGTPTSIAPFQPTKRVNSDLDEKGDEYKGRGTGMWEKWAKGKKNQEVYEGEVAGTSALPLVRLGGKTVFQRGRRTSAIGWE